MQEREIERGGEDAERTFHCNSGLRRNAGFIRSYSHVLDPTRYTAV